MSWPLRRNMKAYDKHPSVCILWLCRCWPPAKICFDAMQVGDASASQSPLSFGGFGCMLRHLQRLTDGLDQALKQDRLARRDLKLLQVGFKEFWVGGLMVMSCHQETLAMVSKERICKRASG